jgi:hypothetical protein
MSLKYFSPKLMENNSFAKNEDLADALDNEFNAIEKHIYKSDKRLDLPKKLDIYPE